MTSDQYLAELAALNLRPAAIRTAQLLGVSVRQAQKYAAGDAKIPDPIARLLALYRAHGLDVTADLSSRSTLRSRP